MVKPILRLVHQFFPEEATVPLKATPNFDFYSSQATKALEKNSFLLLKTRRVSFFNLP